MKKASYLLTLAVVVVIATAFRSFHENGTATHALSNNLAYSTQRDKESTEYSINQLDRGVEQNILNFSATDKSRLPKMDSICSGMYSKQKALMDIKSGKARLLVQGGIAAVYYPTDKSFRETYKIGYELFGCVAPATINCIEEYNQVVFEHLQSTYGDKWKNDVRKDVIGLSTQ